MHDVEELLKTEKNKEIIANIIYHRYYDRYLKPFFYVSHITKEYMIDENSTKTLNEFETEYKSGFIILTNCCLLIETISTFFHGFNRSNNGNNSFELIFQKAKEYNNMLYIFEKKQFYKNIRCGLTHQGETYGRFKISRNGQLFDEENLTINAMLFCILLNEFLKSYCNELKSEDWNSKIWNNCKNKIYYIINNSK